MKSKDAATVAAVVKNPRQSVSVINSGEKTLDQAEVQASMDGGIKQRTLSGGRLTQTYRTDQREYDVSSIERRR